MESGDDGGFLEWGGPENWEVGGVELDVSAHACAWSESLHTLKGIKEGSTQDVHVRYITVLLVVTYPLS